MARNYTGGTPEQKEFVKMFDTLTGKYNRWEVWKDMVWMIAISISNLVDKRYFDQRESIYFDKKVEKDLSEGEEICPTCKGFAIKITENRYGLKNDPDRSRLFPYNHQSLVLCGCPDCYNGVVRRCKFCGELIPRSRIKCECEQQRALDREERERKAAEEFAKAPIAPPEVEKECKVFFSDYMGDGFFEDWDEFFEEWWDEDKDKEFPTRPEYVWITTPDEFRIYAENICENATNDLYEGAYEDISEEHLKRLQSFLDDWCKSSGVGVSYRVSHKYKVRIPWEDYERSYGDDGED